MGYKELVDGFLALKQQHGKKVDELMDLLVNVMVRGNYEELRDFLLVNRALFYDLRAVCAGEKRDDPPPADTPPADR
jgi:hypothetical protein